MIKKYLLKGLCYFIFVSFILCIYGCAPTLKSKALAPAQVNLGGYTKIAVLDFEGKNGKSIAKMLESELLNTKIEEKPYFTIVTRDKLEKILQEQALQLTGAIDPSTAVRIGNILGVEALIVGNVHSYDTEDRNYNRGSDNANCTERTAFINFTVNFINATTGNVETSHTEDDKGKATKCLGGQRKKSDAGQKKDSGLGGLLADLVIDAAIDAAASGIDAALSVNFGPPDQMLNELSKKAIAKFVKKITPQYVLTEIALKDKDDDSGILPFGKKEEQKEIDNALKVGCDFARNNFWDRAIKTWEGVTKKKPNCAAAYYNKAVAYEMKGDFVKSKNRFEKAVDIKPSEEYIKALARIEKKIKEKEEVEKQLRERRKAKQPEQPVAAPPVAPPAAPPLLAPKEAQAAEVQTERQEAAPPALLAPKEAQAAVAPPPPPPLVYLVTIKAANVRTEANAQSKIITQLKKGEKVEKLDKSGNWFKIKLTSGETGWVFKDLVKEEP